MFQKICSILSGIILALLALLAIVLILPYLLGWKNLAVLSGSMEPAIPVGSVVYAVPMDDYSQLQAGDVITYQLNGDTMVTHRVESIDVEKQEIITKGDANDNADGSPVVFSQVVGKVKFHIPYLGYISIYIKTPLGIGIICGVLVVLLLLTFLPDILMEETESNKKVQKQKKNVTKQ